MKEKRKKKKPQGTNIMSSSATQGGENETNQVNSQKDSIQK